MKKFLSIFAALILVTLCLSACSVIDKVIGKEPAPDTEPGGDDECTHIEVTDSAVEPNCTEAGLTEGKHCSVCGEIILKQETVPALGHTEVIDASVAATCTEDGLTSGVHCSVCDTIIIAQEVVPATHTYGEWETVSEGDCFTAGERKRICTACSEEDVEKSIALGHSFVQNEETKLYSCEICNARILNGHLYAAFDVELNWYDAYKYCDAIGGHLVTITSQEEQNLITEIVSNRTLTANRSEYYYWTGALKNTNGWEWITGEDFSYTNWGKKGLDGYTANWHVGITTSIASSANPGMNEGDWEDIYHVEGQGIICEWELDIVEDEHYFTEWDIVKENTCYTDGEMTRICTHCGLEETEVLTQTQHNFVLNESTGVTACKYCSAAIYNGHIYKIFEISISWYDAYTYCKELCGHLLTIISAEEQTFVETYMNANSYNAKTWIGGYNDGDGFKWITDEEFDYKHNDFTSNNDEFFLEINYSKFGQWNDLPSNAKRFFICEWDIE